MYSFLYPSLIFKTENIESIEVRKKELISCLMTDGYKNIKEAIGTSV